MGRKIDRLMNRLTNLAADVSKIVSQGRCYLLLQLTGLHPGMSKASFLFCCFVTHFVSVSYPYHV